ncbi:hypothetical protein N7519_008286 [Penicillium mononematosum]|uniref:uncharacterized protein n=1 Tax=Penicillium mononematosum TaxID=268346 RepID=UPI002547F434|nr:uncharacterized protein N7519_008286 [Penicillium mononematosum]KAJ6177825.1 hypothetical protein N7519_008286 [Penicillium mononematosum]
MSKSFVSRSPPDAVKGALDALQRSLVRILKMEAMASIWMVHIVDVASGSLASKLHHLYK